jgi:hypothetical protein
MNQYLCLTEEMYRYVPPSCSLHHHLALSLTKRVGKVRLVVFGDNIIEPRLPTKLVHALRDFIPGSIPEPGEQGQEFAGKGCCSIVPEYDGRHRL